MDRKSLIVIVVCIAVMLLWNRLMDRIYGSRTNGSGSNAVSVVTSATNHGESNITAVTGAPEAASNAVTAPVTVTNVSAANLPNWSNATEQTLEFRGENALYTFTSFGGGLKTVALSKYQEIVDCSQKKEETNSPVTLNRDAPLASIIALGAGAVQGDGLFELSTLPDGTGVRAEKDLPNGLRLVKDFVPGSNYLVTATVHFENTSGNTLAIPPTEWLIGTASPLTPAERASFTVGVDWFNGKKLQRVTESYFANRTLGCFAGTPRTTYSGGDSNVYWAAVKNQFFTTLVIPDQPALEVKSLRVPLPKLSPEQPDQRAKASPELHGFQTSLVMPGQTVPAGGTADFTYTIYAGPKEYKTLSRLADEIGMNVDSVMGFDASIAGRFGGFFAKLLLLGMNGLHAITGLGYGWVIIVITIIIKLAFWPLTQASTRSMKRMGELQPQMKALQEKYKDDPKKMNQKMMEFWKEHKVNPMGGCLPMLLQFPVFIGFYTMIRFAIELRGASFLWCCDLSQADTVFHLPIPILGYSFPVNPLSLIMAASMWTQTQMMPTSPTMDPAQQKLMKYMPLMFVVILYNFSAGMTLYWTTQNILTVVQTKLTRASEEKKKAQGTPQGTPATPGAPVKPTKSKRKRR